ncbi:MAG: hypothetical protein INH41_22010 [Myxococcaceae bacterium]|nr:hypothetical protein [Myxococcaceae bacterium]MCA3015070.1 hypothetical protein [Myxococcaceae bacterium]
MPTDEEASRPSPPPLRGPLQRVHRSGSVAVFTQQVQGAVEVTACTPWHDGDVIAREPRPCEGCGSVAFEGCWVQDCPARRRAR